MNSFEVPRISNRGSYVAIIGIEEAARMEQTPYVQVLHPRRRSLWKQDSENATECIDLHASPDVFWGSHAGSSVQGTVHRLIRRVCAEVTSVSQNVQSRKGPTACTLCMQAHSVTTRKQDGGVWTAEEYAWT